MPENLIPVYRNSRWMSLLCRILDSSKRLMTEYDKEFRFSRINADQTDILTSRLL